MTDLSKCSLCGLCKSNCPVFKVMLKEKYSPRGKVMLLKEEKADDLLYFCTMCGACRIECPVDLDIDIRQARKKLIRDGHETQANRKMIENIRKFGNPFGEKKDDDPAELYCC